MEVASSLMQPALRRRVKEGGGLGEGRDNGAELAWEWARLGGYLQPIGSFISPLPGNSNLTKCRRV